MQIFHFLCTPHNKIGAFKIKVFFFKLPSNRLSNLFEVLPIFKLFLYHDDSLSVIANTALQYKHWLYQAFLKLLCCLIDKHHLEYKKAII